MRISDWSSDVCSSDLARRCIDRHPHMHIVFEDQRSAVIADRRIEVRKIAQDFAEGTDQQYYGRQLRVRMRLVPFAPPGLHLRHIDIVSMRHMRTGDPVSAWKIPGQRTDEGRGGKEGVS